MKPSKREPAESFDDFCRASFDLLKEQRIKHLVIGGVAVTAVGEPRFTADLDLLVLADELALTRLLVAAGKAGFDLDVEAELAEARAGSSIRLDRGRFHLDLVIRSLFIEDLAYQHGRTRRVFNRSARFPSPEDLLILKIAAGRPQDLIDADGILRRHSATLDRPYVERILVQLCDLAEDHAVLHRWRELNASTSHASPDRQLDAPRLPAATASAPSPRATRSSLPTAPPTDRPAAAARPRRPRGG